MWQAYFLSDTIGFHGNAAVTGQTPLSHNCYGTMVTIGTNCSYQIPIKTLLNQLKYIEFDWKYLFCMWKHVFYLEMWFADILFNNIFNLTIMTKSIFMTAKTAIKLLSDQSWLSSWISEHKDNLSSVKINIISQ